MPVPDREALLFVTVLGVGGCAIVVDLLTVGLRKPALAGLPMLAIYSVPVAVYVDSVPVLPFIVGAIGFLWLLVADNVDRVRRFGRRFTGDGRDVDVWEPSPLAAAGRRLAVIGVAAAVLLPLVVPGLTTGLLSRLTQVGTGVRQRRLRRRRQRPGQPVRLAQRLADPERHQGTSLKVTHQRARTRSTCGSASPTWSTSRASPTAPRTASSIARGLPDPRRPARRGRACATSSTAPRCRSRT